MADGGREEGGRPETAAAAVGGGKIITNSPLVEKLRVEMLGRESGRGGVGSWVLRVVRFSERENFEKRETF